MKVTRRDAILLYLPAENGGEMSSLGLQKRLFFLAEREKQGGVPPSFDFYPHLRGCFSFTAAYMLQKLRAASLIRKQGGTYSLNDYCTLPKIPYADRMRIAQVVRETQGASDEELAMRVYTRYPFYAINSPWASQLLAGDTEALRRIEECKPRRCDTGALFTIGYEGMSIEGFFKLLAQKGVTCLCDVRCVPFSYKLGFSKEQLGELAHAMNFRYLHLPTLGIASHRRKQLETQEDYDRLFAEYKARDLPGMQSTLRELAHMIEGGERIALMCFEANILQCHRRILAERLSEMLECEYFDLSASQKAIECQKELLF